MESVRTMDNISEALSMPLLVVLVEGIGSNLPAGRRAGDDRSPGQGPFLFILSHTIADPDLIEEVGGFLGVVAQLSA